ncbi:MAG: peptidoglycan DD-metalloendopeptidase family protein [candidate division WOR-3 bacterium]|nr:MAG: peptidoglycan DD-metalloendopeptidase family protein [candidate division WOR-3 bacterium]
MDIILISGKGRKTANLRIKPTYLILILIICVCVIVSFFYNLTSYARKEVDRSRLSTLENENRVVRREITRIERELFSLQGMIDSLETYDKKLRSYAPLRPIDEEMRKMGIGGYTPEFGEGDVTPAVQEELTSLTESLDNLLGRARIQKSSYEELAKHLHEKTHLRDHTPSIMPVQGWMIRGYGYHIDPFTGQVKMHEGLDIAAPTGTPIVAPASGTVRYAGEKKNYGLCIEIDHGYGFVTMYAHCQRIRVNSGMRIRRGDVVAYVGNTGRSTGPHLHYEIRLSRVAVNPLNYILTAASIID